MKEAKDTILTLNMVEEGFLNRRNKEMPQKNIRSGSKMNASPNFEDPMPFGVIYEQYFLDSSQMQHT